MVIEHRRGRKNFLIQYSVIWDLHGFIPYVNRIIHISVQCLTEILFIGLLPFYRENEWNILVFLNRHYLFSILF